MVILITIILSVITPSYSRSPAVEPVTGLDIEKYQHVGQEKSKNTARYDWDNKTNQQRISHPSQGLIKNSSNDLIQNYLLTALMLLLPLSLWPIINKRIKKSEKIENRRTEENLKVTRIHDRRKTSYENQSDNDNDNDDDQDHVPKAS